MDWPLYIKLSLMMFLNFAIWGAWFPVLAAHLLGPLKMSGKQTGWIYSTMWLGCIVAPFVGGQIVDRWMPTEYFLAAVSLGGGVLLLIAAKQITFKGMFICMGLYSLLYANTLGMTFAVMAKHAPDLVGKIRVWGTVGWIVAGVLLTLWRRTIAVRGTTGDSLILGGVLSLIMGVFCFFLPHTAPPEEPGSPWAFVEAFKLLTDPNFLAFMLISFVVATQLQFYYVPTAQFLQDIGLRQKDVPATMTIGQAAEVVTMLVLLDYLPVSAGFRWTLAVGVIAWPARYVIFSMMRPLGLVIASLLFHGLGYALFFTAGQWYVDIVAKRTGGDFANSAQALYVVGVFGIANFLGTQFTGVVMDALKTPEGKFRWRPIFLIPCFLTIACAAAFLVFFNDDTRPGQAKPTTQPACTQPATGPAAPSGSKPLIPTRRAGPKLPPPARP